MREKMILKKEFHDFKNWLLRRHGRRAVNMMGDEVFLAVKIREYFEDTKGITLPEDAFTRNLEASDDTGNSTITGDPKPSVD